MSKERVETFSDGVFAIILTLLVLELQVPHIPEQANFSQYLIATAPLIPKFVGFVLSFIIICIHWVSHHYFFSHLKDAPLGIVWLNNLFLLWICFMPFPTAFFGDHPTDQFPILLFGVNQLCAAVTFMALRYYARYNKLFIGSAKTLKSLGPVHSIPAIVFYTLSVIFVFINIYASLVCFFIVLMLYFIPNLIRTK